MVANGEREGKEIIELLSKPLFKCSGSARVRSRVAVLRCEASTAALTDLLLNEAFSDRRSRHWILPD